MSKIKHINPDHGSYWNSRRILSTLLYLPLNVLVVVTHFPVLKYCDDQVILVQAKPHQHISNFFLWGVAVLLLYPNLCKMDLQVLTSGSGTGLALINSWSSCSSWLSKSSWAAPLLLSNSASNVSLWPLGLLRSFLKKGFKEIYRTSAFFLFDLDRLSAAEKLCMSSSGSGSRCSWSSSSS